MVSKLGLLTFFLLINSSFSNPVSKLYIFPQWHLSPDQFFPESSDTKKIPQYENQFFIFEKIKKMTLNNEVNTVISEGCGKSEITEEFKVAYNKWDYQKLDKLIKKKFFDDILTLVPLKLEVLFKNKLKTLCGDNLELIKQQQLALSDLRAYLGILIRLRENKDNPKKFASYAELLKNDQNLKKLPPLELAKGLAQDKYQLFKNLIAQRNNSFIDLIGEGHGNMALIIGKSHLPDLIEKLKSRSIYYELVEVPGLPNDDIDVEFEKIIRE